MHNCGEQCKEELIVVHHRLESVAGERNFMARRRSRRPRPRPAAEIRHRQRITHQLRRHAGCHRPANDAASPAVEHGSKVKFTTHVHTSRLKRRSCPSNAVIRKPRTFRPESSNTAPPPRRPIAGSAAASRAAKGNRLAQAEPLLEAGGTQRRIPGLRSQALRLGA